MHLQNKRPAQPEERRTGGARPQRAHVRGGLVGKRARAEMNTKEEQGRTVDNSVGHDRRPEIDRAMFGKGAHNSDQNSTHAVSLFWASRAPSAKALPASEWTCYLKLLYWGQWVGLRKPTKTQQYVQPSQAHKLLILIPAR
jgi:hypothetical protein